MQRDCRFIRIIKVMTELPTMTYEEFCKRDDVCFETDYDDSLYDDADDYFEENESNVDWDNEDEIKSFVDSGREARVYIKDKMRISVQDIIEDIEEHMESRFGWDAYEYGDLYYPDMEPIKKWVEEFNKLQNGYCSDKLIAKMDISPVIERRIREDVYRQD